MAGLRRDWRFPDSSELGAISGSRLLSLEYTRLRVVLARVATRSSLDKMHNTKLTIPGILRFFIDG